MDVTTEWHGGVLVVGIGGRVSESNVDALAREVHSAFENKNCSLLMDLERLAYINKGGLRILPQIAWALPGGVSNLAICSVPVPFQRIFETTGFDKVFAMYPSRAQALARLVPEQSGQRSWSETNTVPAVPEGSMKSALRFCSALDKGGRHEC